MEGTEFAEKLGPIFARLNLLVAYLQGFEVKRKVYVNPLGSLNDKFFKGSILFQCVFDSKRRDVFAAGGRYDRLIREFSPKVLPSHTQAHAVGFNLSWDRLSSSMLEYLKSPMKTSLKPPEETGTSWRTRRVSGRHCFASFILANFTSAMCLSPASMLQCYELLVSRLFKIYGQMISVQSLQLTHLHLKSFFRNIEKITTVGS